MLGVYPQFFFFLPKSTGSIYWERLISLCSLTTTSRSIGDIFPCFTSSLKVSAEQHNFICIYVVNTNEVLADSKGWAWDILMLADTLCGQIFLQEGRTSYSVNVKQLLDVQLSSVPEQLIGLAHWSPVISEDITALLLSLVLHGLRHTTNLPSCSNS